MKYEPQRRTTAAQTRMIALLREAFPLKKIYILYGVPFGALTIWGIFYPGWERKLIAVAVIVIARRLVTSQMPEEYWRAAWKHYRGWIMLGGLIAGIPYDWIVEESARRYRSSALIVGLQIVVLVFHVAAVYFGKKGDEEEEKEVEKPPMAPKKKAVIIVSLSLAVVLLLGYVIKPHVVRFPKDASVSWCKTVGDETVHRLPAEDAAEVVEILNSYGGWEFTTCSWFTLKAVTIGEMTVYMDDSCTHCHYDGNGRRMCLDLREKDTAALKAIFEQS